ncbi:RecQ family ATP-dependent DNA helicase [Solibacillus merdavium]|uniref:ATP-dependent DNA helicase RecQ n=1 Tax=Solibacillus merdavium TaxID=2762218 RepID=A0ABR8XJ88_9BACL|nr:RecQ family ATP-dependent DNA helicase [Solibacillus merdavium]MBD8031989.1 ATP-dependent DNA helicase RecQ [Solibacillus merdavium]
MNLQGALKQYFGYDTFRSGQEEIIGNILKGKDVVAILPTGMGKSLCYQLPGYLFQKPVLIVSPLLSLMQDQVDQLKQRGEKRVVALNSFLTMEQKKYALHFLQEYRFIFVSPEMLLQPQVKARIQEMELSLIVADEAHCISQWGFDFRPDYLRIGEVLPESNRPPILALSATATDSVLRDIKSYLNMDEPFQYMHTVNRENIHLVKKAFMNREEKIEWIIEHVKNTAGPGIIYTQSRAKAEAISLQLIQQNVAAAAYHAGKETQDRQFIQQQFLAGKLEWIVATNAFGMGIHKENVRQVIHETMPATLSNYMQEIGRAGRDGNSAVAFLLYCDGDEQFAKFIATEDLPKEVHIDRFMQTVAAGEHPESLYTKGELSEVVFRVLSYWLARESAEKVKSRMLDLQLKKFEEVELVLNLISHQECMRRQVVRYFGQELLEQQENCCTNCGIELSNLVQKRDASKTTVKMTNWQQRLDKLLARNL